MYLWHSLSTLTNSIILCVTVTKLILGSWMHFDRATLESTLVKVFISSVTLLSIIGFVLPELDWVVRVRVNSCCGDAFTTLATAVIAFMYGIVVNAVRDECCGYILTWATQLLMNFHSLLMLSTHFLTILSGWHIVFIRIWLSESSIQVVGWHLQLV